jgi:KDO2-lipid IV(A) lauroyltransferase
MKHILLSLKTWLEYLGFQTVRLVALLFTFRMASVAGRILGGAVFRWTSVRKRVTLENLARGFPEKTAAERRAIASDAYRNYGRAILEMLWAWKAPPEQLRRIVHPVNLHLAQDAHRRNKGLILLSAHFGSWELLLSGCALHLGWPIGAIVQKQRNRKIDALIDLYRSRFDVRTIPMGQSVREVLKWLNERQVLVLLGDQSGSKESVYVPFFGRPAATHRGPAAFALKTGAPLVMQFLVRREDGEYDFLFEEVEYGDLKGYTEENIVELTRRHTVVLERFIRAHPDHWLWMHKRWKHTAYYESHRQELGEPVGGAPA